MSDADLERAIGDLMPRDAAGVNRLADLLLRRDRSGDTAAPHAPLRSMAQNSSLLVALDHVARGPYHSAAPGWADIARDRFRDETGGVIATALASLHRDGRVREAAVNAMLASQRSDLLPFVALRAADRVPQVRDRARAGLALGLYEASAGTLELVIPVTLRLAGRRRGDFARRQVTAA